MGGSGWLVYRMQPLAALSAGVVLALWVIAWAKIFFKAGYRHPVALALLMLIPIANFVLLCLLAFSKWPIQRHFEMMEKIGSIPRFQ